MARKDRQRGEQRQWLLTPRAIAAQRPRRKTVPVWTFDEPALLTPAPPQRAPERARRKSPLPSRRGVVQNDVTQRRMQTRLGGEMIIERGISPPGHRVNGKGGRRHGFMDIMRAMKYGESAVFPLKVASARAMAHKVFGGGNYEGERVDEHHTRIWNLKGR